MFLARADAQFMKAMSWFLAIVGELIASCRMMHEADRYRKGCKEKGEVSLSMDRKLTSRSSASSLVLRCC